MNKTFELFTYNAAKIGSLVSLLMLSTAATLVPMRPVDAQAITLDPTVVIPGTQNADAEEPDILTSGRNVYILWHEASEINPADNVHEVWLSRSSNRGRVFNKRVNVSNSEILSSEEEQVAVSGRNVYVVWTEDDGLGNTDVWFARSLDRGDSFELAEKLSITVGAIKPEIAAYRHNVYVAWETGEEIYFVESDDAGDTFDMEENISNTAAAMSNDPEVAVSGNRVIVTWREDAVTPTGSIETVYRQGN